jgi:predicted nuclease of predicted toxin-antitoxin system
MKLLLDANLSWRLTTVLKKHFTDCVHVDKSGLEIPAADNEIWDYALKNNFVIVTNDEDFLDFSNVKGFPPKVVLLRTGNQSSQYIESLLIKHKSTLESFVISEEFGLLEIIE